MNKVHTTGDIIRKCCETEFSYPVRARKQYQEPKKYNVSAKEVFKVQEKITSFMCKEKVKKKSPEQKEELKQLGFISILSHNLLKVSVLNTNRNVDMLLL